MGSPLNRTHADVATSSDPALLADHLPPAAAAVCPHVSPRHAGVRGAGGRSGHQPQHHGSVGAGRGGVEARAAPTAAHPTPRDAERTANLKTFLTAGPFEWVHSFFPDNNTSYDMTLYLDPDTHLAFLIRSCPVQVGGIYNSLLLVGEMVLTLDAGGLTEQATALPA